LNENRSGLKRSQNTLSEMIRREEKIRIDSKQSLEGSHEVIPEFISKMPSEIGAALNGESESQDDEDEEESGIGMVLGMSVGVAIGAVLENISLYMMIGLAFGILLDARMGCVKSKD
jgi:hypothetical protein